MVYISRPKPPEWPLNYVYLNFQVCIMGSFCEFKPPWSGHKRRKRRRIGKGGIGLHTSRWQIFISQPSWRGELFFFWFSNIFNSSGVHICTPLELKIFENQKKNTYMLGFSEAADILSIVEFIELEQSSIGHKERGLIGVARYQYIRKQQKMFPSF